MVASSVSGMSETSNQSVPASLHREADAVDGDGALRDDERRVLGVEPEADDPPLLARPHLEHRSGAVDVALHHVAAEPRVGAERALDVDAVARRRVLRSR